MPKRAAVLMKLKAGVTKDEVKELCLLLHRIGEPTWMRNSDGTKLTDKQIVTVYDDQHGDPCFYIP